MRRFEGRVVFVTGAGSGVGRATAGLFADEGAKVFGVDVNRDGITETVTAIKKAGGDADGAHCDVASFDSVTRAVKRAVENDPHWNTTQGGDGCFAARLLDVTSQHDSSDSTFFSTVVPLGLAEESRKISTFICRASGPMNSGRAPSRTAASRATPATSEAPRERCR